MGVTLASSTVVGASSSGALGDVMKDLAASVSHASSTFPRKDHDVMAEAMRKMHPGTMYAMSHTDKVRGPNLPDHSGPGQGRTR